MAINWKHKLRSGALQLTLFISVIIALLLAGIILLAYTHRYFIDQSKAIVGNIQLADNGVAFLCDHESAVNDTISLPTVEGSEKQSIKVHLSQWGIFEQGIVKTTHRKKIFTKCALIGSRTSSLGRPAIYLAENFNPLSVVGYTEIKGNVILPDLGVVSGNIKGNSYYGKEFVYGKVSKSSEGLPKTKYDNKDYLTYFLDKYEPESQNDFIALGNQKKIFNSFSNREKGYFNTAIITLENVSITGKIIIRSTQKIIVKNTALLKDVLLAAPEIIIEDGVNGNFQAIASTTITIGENCKLNYPSALVIVQKNNGSQSTPVNGAINQLTDMIYIGSNSSVKGSLCYFKDPAAERNYKANVYISERSKITGEIYCEGNTELKSCQVSGSIFTNYFISIEAGTTFVNHIYNSKINSETLPESFGGLIYGDQPKSVMKWLY